MHIKKRVGAFLLCALMLLTDALPVYAVPPVLDTDSDMELMVPAEGYIPPGAITVFSEGATINGTTTVFACSAAIVDSSEYNGLALEAINIFVNKASDILPNTVFGEALSRGIPVNANSANFLLDTIDITYMQQRYLGGQTGYKLACVSTDEVSTRFENAINALMNSERMSGTGSNNICLNIYDYLDNAEDIRKCVLAAYNKGTIVPIIKVSDEGNTVSGNATSDDIKKSTTDLGDGRMHLVVVMFPVIAPKVENNTNRNISLVVGNYFYDNVNYLIRSYNVAITGKKSASKRINTVGRSAYQIISPQAAYYRAWFTGSNYGGAFFNQLYKFEGDNVAGGSGIEDLLRGYAAFDRETPLLCLRKLIDRIRDYTWFPSCNDILIMLATLSNAGAVSTSDFEYTLTNSDGTTTTLTGMDAITTALSNAFDGTSTLKSTHIEKLVVGLEGTGLLTRKYVPGVDVYTPLPFHNRFNISNTGNGKAYAIGSLNSGVYNKITSTNNNTGIIFHNIATSVYAPRFVVIDEKTDDFVCSASQVMSVFSPPVHYVDSVDLPALKDKQMFYLAYMLLACWLNPMSNPIQVDTEYKESQYWIYLKGASRPIVSLEFTFEDEAHLSAVKSAFTEEGTTGLDVVNMTVSGTKLTIPLIADTFTNTTCSFPAAAVTEDIECKLVGLGKGIINSINQDFGNVEIKFYSNKEYEADAKTWVKVNSDMDEATLFFAKSDSPIKTNIDIDGENGTEIADGETVKLYEGISTVVCPQFEVLPVTAGNSYSITVKFGDTVVSTKALSGITLEALNNYLVNDVEVALEYFDVGFGDSDKVLEDDLVWAVEFSGDVDVSYGYSAKVEIYKWKDSVEMKIIEPEGTAVSSGSELEVSIRAANRVDRTESDTENDVLATGKFKVVHTFTAACDNNEYLLELGTLTYYSGEGEVNNSDLTATTKNIDSFADAALALYYDGTLNVPDGDWVCVDTVSFYSYSYYEGDYKLVSEAEASVTLSSVTLSSVEGEPIIAAYDKEFANVGDLGEVQLDLIKHEDYGIIATNPEVEVESKNDNCTVLNVVASTGRTSSGVISTNVCIEVSFKEEDVYTASDFVVKVDGVRIPLTVDNANVTSPYATCTVPQPANKLYPFAITLSVKDSVFNVGKGAGKTAIIYHELTLSPTEDYEEWLNETTASSLSLTLSLNCSNSVLSDVSGGWNGLTMEVDYDTGTITLTGTKADIANAFGSTINIKHTFTNPGTVSMPDSGKITATLNYSTTIGTTIYPGESSDSADWTVDEVPFETLTFENTVGSGQAYAVLTSTLPDPSRWRWDTMSAFPCTETLSVSVGADIFSAGLTGTIIAIGNPLPNGALGNGSFNVNDTPMPNAAITRTFNFYVWVSDWWGDPTSGNEPCPLTCRGGHALCNGGESHSWSSPATGSVQATNGTTVSADVACPGYTYTCTKCGYHWEHAVHTERIESTGEDKELCTHCGGESCCGCETSPATEDKPAKYHSCSAHGDIPGPVSSYTCTANFSHDCTWAATWNCSNDSDAGVTITGGPNTQASVGSCTTKLNPASNQHYQVDVTIIQPDELVEGSWTDDSVVCMGYTQPDTYGCVHSSAIHNNVHRKNSNTYQFKIVEAVDAVAFSKIDSFYVNVLADARVEEAAVIYENADGRTVVAANGGYTMWRGDDDHWYDDNGDTSAGVGTECLDTGRVYFDTMMNAFFNPSPGGSTALDSIDTINATTDVKIYIRLTADSKIDDQSSDYTLHDEYPIDVVNNRGSVENHYKPVGSTNEDYKENVGDVLTAEEIKNICYNGMNAWMYENNKESIETLTCVGDVLELDYQDYTGVMTGLITDIHSHIHLFNIAFTDTRTTVYRNHYTGCSDLNALSYKAKAQLMTEISGTSNFFTGYTGAYTPDSPDTMYNASSTAENPVSITDVLGNSGLYDYSTALVLIHGTTHEAKHVTETSVATVSGVSSINASDEFYGKCVGSVSTTGSVKFEDQTITGECLFPGDRPELGYYINEQQVLSFLGIRLKPNTPNGVYTDSMKVMVDYLTLGEEIYNTDNAVTPVDTVKQCVFESGGTEMQINPLVVLNPIADSTKMFGNLYGNDPSIYAVDESKEDYRLAPSGNDYIVIGNTFNVWVSAFNEAPEDSTSHFTATSMDSWGNGVSCDVTTGQPFEGAHGVTDTLCTEEWCSGQYIQFDFPVSKDGVVYPAGTLITLWEKSYDENGNEIGKTVYITPDFEGSPDGTPADYFGRRYTFTCELSAEESSNATWTSYTSGINIINENVSEGSNTEDRSNLVANQYAKTTGTVEIVGRIGDLMVTDVEDYRYSNVFWGLEDSYLIEGIIFNTNTEMFKTIRAGRNMFLEDGLPYGTCMKTASDNKGIPENYVKLPLCSDVNVLPEFSGEQVGVGYNAYISISTIGEYTGINSTTQYPKSFTEELSGVTDNRGNLLIVEPIYALYDPDTDKFYDIELWAGNEAGYVRYWNSKTYDLNYANALMNSCDSEIERLRHGISNFAYNYGLTFRDTTSNLFTEDTYIGNSKKIKLDCRSNYVQGTKFNEVTPQFYSTTAPLQFTFDKYTASYDAVSMGKVNNADYAVNSRRWCFELGLPASSLVTYPGCGTSVYSVKTSNTKLTKEHPNAVLVVFAKIYAQGSVYTLKYDYEKINGDCIMTINGKTVNFSNREVYINGSEVSYTIQNWYAPLFVSEVVRTSTDDILHQGSH